MCPIINRRLEIKQVFLIFFQKLWLIGALMIKKSIVVLDKMLHLYLPGASVKSCCYVTFACY